MPHCEPLSLVVVDQDDVQFYAVIYTCSNLLNIGDVIDVYILEFNVVQIIDPECLG